MGVLDLARQLSEDEFQGLVDDIFTGQVSQEFESAIREEIEAADITLREDAFELNPAFGDLEEVLGLEPSEPVPLPGEEEVEIRERTQAEREARQAIIDLIEANMDDVEVLLDIARALEQEDASLSGLFAQRRIDTLTEMDREGLADRAHEAARTAEPLEAGDFPVLDAAVQRGGGRDATYFRNVIQELRGIRDPQTLPNQGVSADSLDDIREEHPEVVDELVARAQTIIDQLEGRAPEAPSAVEGPAIQPRGGEQVSAAVRRVVPQQARREDPLTGETWEANVDLENRFYAWALRAKPNNRWTSFDFRTLPENRDRSMAVWANAQVRAGNASVSSALEAGLPEEWFEDVD